ncbi:DUF4282 domain-containing protein [Halobacillus sp. BBL2006]|uniref:DUF4282 domain-containing protein n=1 Tax=Halobacillus sp. BBL2006 TaxID=1543706 RepID=UPI0005438A0E|nr:DUF4282 domain-containing protein [Halobacillus sp. BBL2006]KHE66875.1 hypothetical protein LD39_20460 [Halobacillus sp. BBL2006]
MSEYMNFNKMITPTLIKIIFWVGAIFSVVFGIIMIFAGAANPWGGGMQVLAGIFMIIFGPLLTRIYCELLIVQFKMHEALQTIQAYSAPSNSDS